VNGLITPIQVKHHWELQVAKGKAAAGAAAGGEEGEAEEGSRARRLAHFQLARL